mgnify:FL=1
MPLFVPELCNSGSLPPMTPSQLWPLVPILALLALLIAIAFIAKYFGLFNSKKPLSAPQYKKKPDALLSKGEAAFFAALTQAVQSRSTIFAQVQLSRLIVPANDDSHSTSSARRSREQTLQNKIDRKSVDFVLCNPSTLKVQLIIELDDKSHTRDDRKRRDNFLDDALKSAGIKILHIPAASTYNPAALAQLIRTAINPAPS